MSAASVLAVAGVIAMATVGSLAAAADDDDSSDNGGGYPIQVTVLPTTPTASPSASSSPRPSSSSAVIPTPTPTSGELDTLADGEIIGGAIYVSGLHATYLPSFDPGAGVVRSEFTVANISEQSIDSSATFRLTNFFGQELSSVPPTYILRLEPGESRVIRVNLPRAGQWAFETASFTLSPTSLVEGERLPNLTRETAVFFLPWLVLMIIVVGVTALLIVRVVRANPPESVEAYG